MRQLRLVESQVSEIQKETAASPHDYKARVNRPIELTRDHGDGPSFEVKTIATSLVDVLANPQGDEASNAKQSKQDFVRLQSAPFQWLIQDDAPRRPQQEKDEADGDGDVEMAEEPERPSQQEVVKRDQAQGLSPRPETEYTGVFSMPEAIRSYEANLGNQVYHDAVKMQTEAALKAFAE